MNDDRQTLAELRRNAVAAAYMLATVMAGAFVLHVVGLW
jgi:hypothetical protein